MRQDHEEVRRASTVMCRSINAQAEFWMKIGMLAEANPTLSFNDTVRPHSSLGNQTPCEASRTLEQFDGSAPGALAQTDQPNYQSETRRLSL